MTVLWRRVRNPVKKTGVVQGGCSRIVEKRTGSGAPGGREIGSFGSRRRSLGEFAPKKKRLGWGGGVKKSSNEL